MKLSSNVRAHSEGGRSNVEEFFVCASKARSGFGSGSEDSGTNFCGLAIALVEQESGGKKLLLKQVCRGCSGSGASFETGGFLPDDASVRGCLMRLVVTCGTGKETSFDCFRALRCDAVKFVALPN